VAFNKIGVFEKFMGAGERRVEALDMAYLQDKPVFLGGADQGIRFFKVAGKGFLDQGMNAAGQEIQGYFMMEQRRHGYAYRVDFTEKRCMVGKSRDLQAGAYFIAALLVRIADPCQLATGYLFIYFGMQAAEVACSYYSHFDFGHISILAKHSTKVNIYDKIVQPGEI
jgi:hypothetical protein